MRRRRAIDLCVFLGAILLGVALHAHATPECADIELKMAVGSLTIAGVAAMPPLARFETRYVGGLTYQVIVYDPDTTLSRTIDVVLK